jgi:hypothetical protein
MKNIDKVDPEVEVEIAGETVKVDCGFGTAINFERQTGKSLSSMVNPENLMAISNIVAFLHAALHPKNKKYTRKFIEENMDKRLVQACVQTVIPRAVNNAYDFTEINEEDSDDSESEEKKAKL